MKKIIELEKGDVLKRGDEAWLGSGMGYLRWQKIHEDAPDLVFGKRIKNQYFAMKRPSLSENKCTRCPFKKSSPHIERCKNCLADQNVEREKRILKELKSI